MPELRDTNGMYENPAIDRLVKNQEWLCPIHTDRLQSSAYYSPSKDIVVVPMKNQFNIGDSQEEVYQGGMKYYSTLLHEMTHSTMTPERLNRETGGRFGDAKYAKEELVAELTAAMIGNSLGFDSKITDDSAKYIDSWIGVLKKEPKFIVSVMADVNKASDVIFNHIDKQRIALGESPYLINNDPNQKISEVSPIKNASIVKTKDGDFALRASFEGKELGMKSIDAGAAKTYFRLTDFKEKNDFLNLLVRKNFEPEISNYSNKQTHTKTLGI